jgi:hypothetical protein
VECGLRTPAGGWRATRFHECAALFALIVSVADRTQLRPLVKSGIRASASAGRRTVLNECGAMLALVVVHRVVLVCALCFRSVATPNEN